MAALGIKVTFVCYQFRIQEIARRRSSEGLEESVQLAGLCRNSPPVELQPHGGEVKHDSSGLANWIISQAGGEQDAAEFEELLLAMHPPPSCIISDLPWTHQVASKLRLPRVAFHASTAQDLAVLFHAKELFAAGTFPSSPEELVSVPGILKPVRGSEIFSVTSPFLREFFSHQSSIVHQAAGVLCSSFEELEPEACHALSCNRQLNPSSVPIATIGPLVKLPANPIAAHDQPRHEVLKWLDSQAPASVLFVSFGSFAQASPQQMEEIARGVLSAEVPFVWVVHWQAHLPNDLFKDRSDGMVYKGWAPQLDILSHASVGGFMTHCGWNSVMESICCGVPMGVFPFGEEQRANARLLVEELGVGVALLDLKLCLGGAEDVQLDRAHIASMLRELMLNDCSRIRLRQRAAQLRGAAERAAMDAPRRLLSFLTACSASSQALPAVFPLSPHESTL